LTGDGFRQKQVVLSPMATTRSVLRNGRMLRVPEGLAAIGFSEPNLQLAVVGQARPSVLVNDSGFEYRGRTAIYYFVPWLNTEKSASSVLCYPVRWMMGRKAYVRSTRQGD